ncbi:actin-like protein Arp6p [Monosporozyma unispora]
MVNPTMSETPLVIDNGSYEIKFGYADSNKPFRALNALAKDKYGVSNLSNHIKNIKDISSVTLQRPHEMGQLTSWELQSCLWDYCLYNPDEFNGFDLGETTKGTHLITNETCLTLPALSKNMDQVLFEEYEFASVYKAPSEGYIPFRTMNKSDKEITISGKDEEEEVDSVLKDQKQFPVESNDNEYRDFQLVVDSGFNCTWVCPIIKGIPYYKAVKKLDIGGRFLNGLLKETLSFRHYNMMDETLLVNNIKEKCVFMSPVSYFDSFKNKEKTSLQYVLPDFQTSFIGYIHDKTKSTLPANAQTITLKDECFMIPETFFHPEMAKLLKPGIVETILESLSMLPEPLRPMMIGNIVCTGGNFNIPHFATRLTNELQGQLPMDWNCRVTAMKDENELTTWNAMSQFATTEAYVATRVTREEYWEHGVEWCTKNRFGYQNWI